MSIVSIFRTNDPDGPADEGMLRWEIQQKRNDPEAIILKNYRNEYRKKKSQKVSRDVLKKLDNEYCEKLGINIQEFIHKLEIFYGEIEDDEREWREQKYGKQE